MLRGYYDATTRKDNTLTQQSQEVMKKLDGELKITGYANLFNTRYRDVAFPYFVQQNRETFRLFERFKPDMKLKMVYYYDSITVDDRVGAAYSFDEICRTMPDKTMRERAEAMAKRYRSPFRIFKSPEELKARGVDLRGDVRPTGCWSGRPESVVEKLPGRGESHVALGKRDQCGAERVGDEIAQGGYRHGAWNAAILHDVTGKLSRYCDRKR